MAEQLRWGWSVNDEINIQRSSTFCEKIGALIPFPESVTNCDITLMKWLFYVLYKNNIDMIFLSAAVHEIENKRI